MLATGYNVVDYNYAREKGIPVVNVPAYGTASVSQFSIALLLEICHHIGHHSETVHAGQLGATAPTGATGTIPSSSWRARRSASSALAASARRRAASPRRMGMNVLAYDIYPNDSGREIAEYVDLDDAAMRSADVITLHCNLTPENTGMINKENIAKMKDGVILINNARGQLIDEQDVADALNCGKMAAAGLDVVYTEPIRADNPLLKAKNCIITPHISWAPEGEPPAYHGCYGGKYQGVPCGCSCQCGQSVRQDILCRKTYHIKIDQKKRHPNSGCRFFSRGGRENQRPISFWMRSRVSKSRGRSCWMCSSVISDLSEERVMA